MLDLQTAGLREKVVRDPAFVSVRNYEVAHEYGVTPYIKPKDNAVFRPHPANAYEAHVLFATRFPGRWRSVYRWRVKAECAIHSEKAVFGDVKIPIVLMADPGHEQSTWRVEGEEECAVISGVLGREVTGGKERMFLYGPHMADLRRKLPTTTVCMFLA